MENDESTGFDSWYHDYNTVTPEQLDDIYDVFGKQQISWKDPLLINQKKIENHSTNIYFIPWTLKIFVLPLKEQQPSTTLV